MSGHRDRATEMAVIRPAQPRTTLGAVAGATERRLMGALEVPLDQLAPDPDQPRRDWGHDDGADRLEELAASIREFGILQPLVVREEGVLPDGRQRYAIIAGGRRFAAARSIPLATVPVVVRGDEAARVRVIQLVENIQRQDLSPLDEARAYQELMDVEKLSPPVLATRLHVSAQHVRDRLRLLGDQVLADAVERGQISGTAARGILQLPEGERDALRTRVDGGEAVQHGDIAAVRTRLAAAGVANPRRKGEAKKQTSLVPLREGVIEKQTLFVPVQGEGAKKQTSFVSHDSDTTNPPPHHSKHIPASDARERSDTDLIDALVAAIGNGLETGRRAELTTMLRSHQPGSGAMENWWRGVEARLREALA